MALQKTIQLQSGVSVAYHKLTNYAIDYATRYAWFQFSAYIASDSLQPACEVIAKLRLEGSKFDQYLGKGVLATCGKDVNAQAYTASKAEPIISDFGSGVFMDAQDV